MTNRDPCTQPLPFLSATFFFPPPLIDMVDIFMSQTFLAQFDPSSYTPPHPKPRNLSHSSVLYFSSPKAHGGHIHVPDISSCYAVVSHSPTIDSPQATRKKNKTFYGQADHKDDPPPLVCSGNLDLKKRRHILTLYCNIFEGENWNPPQGGRHIRKIDLFRALPKLPLPPPPPIRASCTIFFGRQKRRFCAYYRTK